MNLLFVADGRSPTARSWITLMQKDGHRISLVSSYPCQELPGIVEFHVLPVAFSKMASSGRSASDSTSKSNLKRWIFNKLRPGLMSMRHTLGPLTLPYYQRKFKQLLERIKPELIHAFRIPFEGMLANCADAKYPLIISIWGNDLTLHATGSYGMSQATLRTLSRADGLTADAKRDIRLAKNWGYKSQQPCLVIPGCGGININEVEKARSHPPNKLLELIPADKRRIINPRRLRPGSVRTDVFFEAAGIIKDKFPEVCFLCPGMADQPEAVQYVDRHNLKKNVVLLPLLSQSELWWLFTQSEIMVSPGEHDGIPNSLLEALACGCYPIAGDIESLREWITPGVNGLLYPPGNALALADAIALILENPDRRMDAVRHNLKLIRERADQNLLGKKITGFYHQVAGH